MSCVEGLVRRLEGFVYHDEALVRCVEGLSKLLRAG